MKTWGRVLIILVVVLVLAAGAFGAYYFTRFKTIASIQKVSDLDTGYNLYAWIFSTITASTG